jgi:hypothetical protein
MTVPRFCLLVEQFILILQKDATCARIYMLKQEHINFVIVNLKLNSSPKKYILDLKLNNTEITDFAELTKNNLLKCQNM